MRWRGGDEMSMMYGPQECPIPPVVITSGTERSSHTQDILLHVYAERLGRLGVSSAVTILEEVGARQPNYLVVETEIGGAGAVPDVLRDLPGLDAVLLTGGLTNLGPDPLRALDGFGGEIYGPNGFDKMAESWRSRCDSAQIPSPSSLPTRAPRPLSPMPLPLSVYRPSSLPIGPRPLSVMPRRRV